MLLITGPQRARSKINWARAVLEPAIVLAGAPEKETDPVVALELAIALAAVRELEHDRVEEELEFIRGAVALRTKLATGAHRQDLVPLLTAEASAVAGVETSLAPAATEAGAAWAAADLVAVVEAEDVAAAAAEDKQIISMRED